MDAISGLPHRAPLLIDNCIYIPILNCQATTTKPQP
jgi:hypothetical protein